VRGFALYGETTGETDEFGLPVRYNWAADYRGTATVAYGHTPVPAPEWLNRTINIDTGCVFGGSLTALRYPERELVSVPAAQVYAEPAKPFLAPAESPTLSAQQRHDDVLEIDSVIGKRLINTALFRAVTIREENAIAALEVMSRYAVNPKWLIYLPPTMSPSETHRDEGGETVPLLEHPAEAFAYYLHEGQPRVVCEEKHMGSRAVVVVCRDEGVAQRRFGVTGEGVGVCYTRTGRRFFDAAPGSSPVSPLETELLARLRAALASAGFWDEFKTDWFCLDCELLPWSAKAQELLRAQYAAVGAAANAGMHASLAALRQATDRGVAREQLTTYEARAEMARQFVDAYRRYCWPVHAITDYKLAPFHLLASEGAVHTRRDHVWHMQTLARLSRADPEIMRPTRYKVVDVTDMASQAEGVVWWTELTGSGGEGMVVKPLDFIAPGRRGLAQPGVKCRGREYLRIIYGAEYTAPENLARLRSRGLATKRSLALREFALGIESLERFVRREPLYRVHECVFGVLALESEPVDPRL
jgi:protein phosphatase